MAQLSLERSDIEKLIPHRGDMLLLDKITSNGDTLVCSKYLDEGDRVFEGHFPEHSIYPGVYLVEAMAQAGAVKVNLDASSGKKEGKYYMLKVDKARFRAPALPGHTVVYEVSTSDLDGYYIIEGKAKVEGQLVASATITAMVK